MLGNRTISFTVAACALASTSLEAAQDRLTFQLVSIRKTVVAAGMPAPRSAFTILPDGRFEARGATIGDLARIAFGFEQMDPRSGVIDAPKVLWAEQERFDVIAAAESKWSTPTGDKVPSELRLMLRALLEDRFALKATLQAKRIDVYALRLVDKTAGPGPSLQRSANSCLGPFTISPPGVEANKPPCPTRVDGSRIEAGAVTLSDFARILLAIRPLADRHIVDDTGLEGLYDVRVVLGLGGVNIGQAAVPLMGSSPNDDRVRIAVQKALKEQLGLELRKAKLPVPVLVIDRARRPQED